MPTRPPRATICKRSGAVSVKAGGERDGEAPEDASHQQSGDDDQHMAAGFVRVKAEMAAAGETDGEQRGICPGGGRGRDGDADMLHRREQEEREADVYDHREGREDGRRARVLAGEEAGLEDADQHIGGEAGGEPDEGLGGLRGIEGGEGTALEEDTHDGEGERDERGRRGEREEHRDQQRLALRSVGLARRARLLRWRLSSGSSTVPMAMPMMPSGSW